LTAKFIGLFSLLLCLSFAAYSQNTKGDRPIKNQRQVRETRGKSVKRKERGTTRDIAGRRLRTKGQSSANRANRGYRQPRSVSSRAKGAPDRAAGPRGRVFSQSPRPSRTRAWKGDISGYPIKRVKPSGADAARHNVYPQKGPYVRYARKQPKKKPPVYARTIKGNRFVEHRPRTQERAWKGGVDKGPIKNQSATGTVRNIYSQKGPYVRYYKKRAGRKERSVSNRTEISQVRRYSRKPKTGGSQPRVYLPSSSGPYVQRGRKNVYWGKFQKKERPVTTDITGGPLRTRNYRSPVAGLVGRDTLQFFGRKPQGDRSRRASAGGYVTATGKGQRGWKGDIAGWKIRQSKGRKTIAGIPLPGTGQRTRSKHGEQAHLNSIMAIVYARDLSGRVKKGKRPPAKGGGSIRAQWNNKGNPISGRAPGPGYLGAARFSGTFKQGQLRPGFSRESAGYSGNMKRGAAAGFSRSGANYSGNMKRGGRGFSQQGFGYSGNMNRSQVRGFSRQGVEYSGNVPRSILSEFSGTGLGYSGFIKRSRTRGFSSEGANYSGSQKGRKGFSGEYIGYSGTLKRGQIPAFSRAGANYAGNQKSRKGFGGEYIGYSGTLKQSRSPKGGGSISGILWNNKNQSVSRSSLTPMGSYMARYPGNIERVGAVKQFGENGVSYSGFVRRGALVKEYGEQGVRYSGNMKRSSVAGFERSSAGFSGRTKYKKPEKGGGSISGILWNNKETALSKYIPIDAAPTNYSGRIAQSRIWKSHIQNPNAAPEALLKHRPGQSVYLVGGLQVGVKEQKYSKNSKASKYALPGIAPRRSSVKASEYTSNMKQYWNYKRNPNSSSGALKTIAPGKAQARIRDFQGNVKMHKFSLSGLHPDAQFAHGEDDNVKGERSIFTNVKLFWSRMFRKNDTQPDNLKDKIKKPQYDKREKGLWAY